MAFNREDFAVRSKSELLDYIEQQCEQVTRLETRFRDVVRAYRGTLKEKEALEASLNALSQVREQQLEIERGEGEGREEGEVEDDKDNSNSLNKSSEISEGDNEVAIDNGETKSEAEESEKESSFTEKKVTTDASLVLSLRQQLSTVTVSLQTMTSGKTKMEASYQKDKKNMLAQQDLLSRQHSAAKKEYEEKIDKLESALHELEMSLKMERAGRDNDQNTHAIMMRELQTIITSEREGKEMLGLQIQDLESELLGLRSQITDQKTVRDRELEEVVQSLTLHVENLQAQLKLAEKRSSQPSAELIQLQGEVQRLKEDHVKALLLEQQRGNDSEERLKQQTLREEQNVANLEMKMSELSETIGSYVQLREQDQVSMERLRERVMELDLENTQLTKAHVERQETRTQTSAQVTALQEKVSRLKTLLKMATSKITENTVARNLEEMTVGEYRDLIGRESSAQYQQELLQLKDDFDRYKTRAQNVLRSKENKDTNTPPVQRKDIHNMQTRLLELQEEVHRLQTEKEEEQERHLVLTRKLREEIREIADRNRAEVVTMETQHKEKLQDLHHHVQSTRERTIKLLAQKDSEISHLRGELQALRSQSHTGGLERSLSHVSTSSSNHQDGLGNGNGEQESTPSLFQTPSRKHINLSTKSTESVTAVQEILEQPSPTLIKEPQLLHFIQEQHRRNIELASVRRKRFELEESLRDLQEREQHHLEQSAFLKDQIRKLERDRSRETESMEYLKNIIFHFMCSDSYGRDQMLSPIATVLHFSPEEVRLIKERTAARRWIPRNS